MSETEGIGYPLGHVYAPLETETHFVSLSDPSNAVSAGFQYELTVDHNWLRDAVLVILKATRRTPDGYREKFYLSDVGWVKVGEGQAPALNYIPTEFFKVGDIPLSIYTQPNDKIKSLEAQVRLLEANLADLRAVIAGGKPE